MAVIKYLIKVSLKRKACFNVPREGNLGSRREENSDVPLTAPSSLFNVYVVYTCTHVTV